MVKTRCMVCLATLMIAMGKVGATLTIRDGRHVIRSHGRTRIEAHQRGRDVENITSRRAALPRYSSSSMIKSTTPQRRRATPR